MKLTSIKPNNGFQQCIESEMRISPRNVSLVRTRIRLPTMTSCIFSNKSLSVSANGQSFALVHLWSQIFARFFKYTQDLKRQFFYCGENKPSFALPLTLGQSFCCCSSAKSLWLYTFFPACTHLSSIESSLVLLEVVDSTLVLIRLVWMSCPHQLNFESLKSPLNVIIVGHVAGEDFVRRKLSIVKIFCIAQSFIWKITFVSEVL